MTHSGNLMVTSAVDASSGGTGIAPVTSVTESLLPTTNGLSVGMPSGSFNSSDGNWTFLSGKLAAFHSHHCNRI